MANDCIHSYTIKLDSPFYSKIARDRRGCREEDHTHFLLLCPIKILKSGVQCFFNSLLIVLRSWGDFKEKLVYKNICIQFLKHEKVKKINEFLFWTCINACEQNKQQHRFLRFWLSINQTVDKLKFIPKIRYVQLIDIPVWRKFFANVIYFGETNCGSISNNSNVQCPHQICNSYHSNQSL